MKLCSLVSLPPRVSLNTVPWPIALPLGDSVEVSIDARDELHEKDGAIVAIRLGAEVVED